MTKAQTKQGREVERALDPLGLGQQTRETFEKMNVKLPRLLMPNELLGEVTDWFEQAFGHAPKYDPMYFQEWAERFQRGEDYAVSRMDSAREDLWKKRRIRQ